MTVIWLNSVGKPSRVTQRTQYDKHVRISTTSAQDDKLALFSAQQSLVVKVLPLPRLTQHAIPIPPAAGKWSFSPYLHLVCTSRPQRSSIDSEVVVLHSVGRIPFPWLHRRRNLQTRGNTITG